MNIYKVSTFLGYRANIWPPSRLSSILTLIDPVHQKMGALLSQRRDDGITSRPSLLVDPSDDWSKVESPLSKLPTELIMRIFQQYEPLFWRTSRIALTHICRRWRQIAINDASLWTRINIQTVRRGPRLDCFLSFLGMQFDRSVDLLLDVEWEAVPGDEYFLATLKLIREKAPFSRWRTLAVHLFGGSPKMWPWSSVDRFTNLESVHFGLGAHNTIASVIERTITSRLKVLDLQWDTLELAQPKISFAKSLTYISSLCARDIHQTGNTPILPSNVTNLRLSSGDQHQFPHIVTYTILWCTFNRHADIDLRSITTFIVQDRLKIHCRVILPALQELRLGTLQISQGGSIQAPALDILRFTGPYGPLTPISWIEGSLLSPGYLLSPNISITTNVNLCSTTVVAVLAKSPNVISATLEFWDWAEAEPVLERLVGFGMATDSRSVENEGLCPRLSELTLDFQRAFSESSPSREWIRDRLKARRDAVITPSLAIYARWKGERAYTLLTCD